jgi:hypothetical protein
MKTLNINKLLVIAGLLAIGVNHQPINSTYQYPKVSSWFEDTIVFG